MQIGKIGQKLQKLQNLDNIIDDSDIYIANIKHTNNP